MWKLVAARDFTCQPGKLSWVLLKPPDLMPIVQVCQRFALGSVRLVESTPCCFTNEIIVEECPKTPEASLVGDSQKLDTAICLQQLELRATYGSQVQRSTVCRCGDKLLVTFSPTHTDFVKFQLFYQEHKVYKLRFGVEQSAPLPTLCPAPTGPGAHVPGLLCI